jgi:hypothetical protein
VYSTLLFPPLLLKPAAQKERMDWNSLTRSSRLRVAPVAVPVVLWSLPLFRFTESHHCLRDTIYVIIILYSLHLVICEHFWPYVWNNWSWVMHMMSTWFWCKNQVWQILRHLCTQLRFASKSWATKAQQDWPVNVVINSGLLACKGEIGGAWCYAKPALRVSPYLSSFCSKQVIFITCFHQLAVFKSL